jgi:hypothetical protein
MIPYLGCEAAREMLQPFVDLELPVGEQVVLESHLRWCDTCAARVEDMRLIGAALRLGSAARPVHAEDAGALAAIQSEVLTRIRAEHDQSLPVRFRELFVDMRLLWPALGATAALAVCLFAVTIVNRVARVELPDSMADRISRLANPGSDRNPLQLDSRMLAPRPLNEGPALNSILGEEAVFALAAVVTREGRVGNFELLQSSVRESGMRRGTADDSDEISALLDAVRRSRFTPAQTTDGVVAVNVVWLLARTTVKASIDPKEDTESLPPLSAPAVGGVVKPLNGALARPVLRPARS